MKLVYRTVVLGLVLALGLLGLVSFGCSGSKGSSEGPPSEVGKIGLNLTFGNGATLASLSYSVTNAVAADDVSGTIPLPPGPFTAGQVLPTFEILPVISATGYSVSLTGTSPDGSITCSGGATGITVTAGNETIVNVLVTCTMKADSGSVEGNVTLQSCPTISTLTAINATATTAAPGNTSTIYASAAAPNPAALTYTFSIVSGTGTLSGQTNGSNAFGTSSSIIFTCPLAPEVDTIEIVTADQTAPAMCPASLSTATITVTCTAPAPFCTGLPVGTACDAGLICNGGGSCVVPTFSVVHVMDGDSGLTNASSAVIIEQHLLDGAVTGTPIALPTAASGTIQPFTVAGTANTEGDLNTSVDGRYLTMAGYQTAPGVVGVVTSQTVNRAVARIDANGNIMTTAVAGAFIGANPRSAVSVDGSEFWLSGTSATSNTSGGIWYLPSDMELVQMPSSALPTDKARLLRIAGGQLYGNSDQDPPYLFTVGSGLPTTATTITTLPGFPTTGVTPSPYSFVFFDLDPTVPGLDTMYVADDRVSTGGGFEKWKLSAGGGSWLMIWSVMWGVDAGVGTGFRGMAGYVTGNIVTLMASSGLAAGTPDSLAVIFDTVGSTTPPTPQVVATAASNSTFRGVALPPHL
jgi:hypothetical protein